MTNLQFHRFFSQSAIAGIALMASTAAQAESWNFAPLPMEEPETVVKQFKPMLAHLEKNLSSTIRIEYSSDYAEILEKFRQGKLDLAYLGPLPYITLKDKFPAAQPVVHFAESSGKASYTCAIIAPSDKNVTLASLKGKKIALTQPLSTCGYLSTDGLLRKAGSSLAKNRYRYLDKHDEVALAVARGEFDAGGLKTAIGKKYTHMGVTVIAETAPLPSFALIANSKTVPANRIEQLRKILTGIQPLTHPADKELVESWGNNLRYGAVAAQDSDYDAVRQLRKQGDIPMQGNF